mgnify:CR=1 FL=1
MSRYVATIKHHSLARAPQVAVGDTLHAAKCGATREFGGGFLDHAIVIFDMTTGQRVASRVIRDKVWNIHFENLP